eukprot:3234942-Amphidinium_carterae.1
MADELSFSNSCASPLFRSGQSSASSKRGREKGESYLPRPFFALGKRRTDLLARKHATIDFFGTASRKSRPSNPGMP